MPVEATLAGKTCAKFHIDIGFGDALTEPPERLTGDDVLAFAGIAPVKVLAIPKAQQFAEKVHAYTFSWVDRSNTRTRDLVDLILLIEGGLPDPARIRRAIQGTFGARGTHSVPRELPPPPEAWRTDFELLAREAQLPFRELNEGYEHVARFWELHSLSA